MKPYARRSECGKTGGQGMAGVVDPEGAASGAVVFDVEAFSTKGGEFAIERRGRVGEWLKAVALRPIQR